MWGWAACACPGVSLWYQICCLSSVSYAESAVSPICRSPGPLLCAYHWHQELPQQDGHRWWQAPSKVSGWLPCSLIAWLKLGGYSGAELGWALLRAGLERDLHVHQRHCGERAEARGGGRGSFRVLRFAVFARNAQKRLTCTLTRVLQFFDENMILRDVAIGGCKIPLTQVCGSLLSTSHGLQACGCFFVLAPFGTSCCQAACGQRHGGQAGISTPPDDQWVPAETGPRPSTSC